MYTNEFDEARINKMELIKEQVELYSERFEKTHELTQAAMLDDDVSNVKVVGRIIFMRKMGKLSFIFISDIHGKLQVALKKDTLGDDVYNLFNKGYDIGDFIGVDGEMFTTKTGEKTIRASKIYFLGKALRSLPEKFHGISNVDSCYRQRYLDLNRLILILF